MKISVLTPTIRPEKLRMTQLTLEDQTFNEFEWLVEVGMHGRGFTLPSDMNKMLRRAQGEVVVILQDCIAINPDALARIQVLDFEKKAYTFPVGKVKENVVGQNVEWDWRKTRTSALGESKVTANMWETDFGAAPLQMFRDIGGYDEDFNKGWSFDNVEVAWRAEAAGYQFHNLELPFGVAVDHDAIMEHPHRNTLPLNNVRANRTADRARHGDFKLNFL